MLKTPYYKAFFSWYHMKNLINKILREQDDIGITKQRFKVIQMVIGHIIVAILTIAISVPVIYYTINASLEASINNYRKS